MPTTPEKKRSGSMVASPEVGSSKSRPSATSAATERPGMERRRRKKNYQFAPINKLDPPVKTETNVLRSISVSQVRNTAFSSLKQSQKLKRASAPPQVVSRRENSLKPPARYTEEDGPTEEVIWKYSPNEKDLSDKVNSSNENSENLIDTDAVQDPSSTPMVPSRLKSVLSFCNINDKEQSEPQTTLSLHRRDCIRERGNPEFSKESLRDIDDILGDIEGDLRMKPNAPRLNDLPSSPSGITQHQEPQNIAEDSTIDGDESLIEFLTQNGSRGYTASKVSTTESPPRDRTGPDDQAHQSPLDNSSTESELLDDSLLEYFDDNTEENDENSLSMDRRDLEQVGMRLSQNLNIEKANSGTKQASPTSEFEEYIELAKCAVKREGIVRLVVLSATQFQLPKIGRQKILNCIDSEGKTSSVMVRHPWVYLEFTKGDVLHIIEGQNITNKRLLSDDVNPQTQLKNDNLLILNPDVLLSATSVGSSIECLRRAVLQTIIEDPRGEPSIVMTIGNIVHELLQEALRCKLEDEKLTTEYLEEVLDSILKTYSFAIFVCGATIEAVKDEVMKIHASNVLNFVNQFVRKNNFGCYVSVSGTRRTQPISIPSVLDIEENIWSHSFGLKGFLDATVLAHAGNEDAIVPLEVKTGKTRSISHEAQGLIYTLLLRDKYEVPVDYFLLLYTRNNDLTKYPKVLHSVKHVIMSRNQMAVRLKYKLSEIKRKEEFEMNLPPLLQNSLCDNCYAKEPCMVMNNLLENGTAKESGLRNGEYEALTRHLLLNHEKYKNFFKKYNDLITKEESSISHMNKQLFLLDSRSKESLSGLCLSNLCVVGVSGNVTAPGELLYEFKRSSSADRSQSMLHSQLNLNDKILISDERGHFALCQGYVNAISRDSIVVSTKKKLPDCRNIAHRISSATVEQPAGDTRRSMTYRLDKNSIEHGLSLTRFNLLNLFLPPIIEEHVPTDAHTDEPRQLKKSEGGDARMRAFLVDKVKPTFLDEKLSPLIPYNVSDISSFNSDQRTAIKKIARARDYALILGMPGSGKTTLIAQVIKMLVAAGKDVLLTSYTHSAVDNILLKLKPYDEKIVRLGSKGKIHPEIRQYMPCYEEAESYQDIIKQISDAHVVATTCLGLNNIFFTLKSKDFDYVILDEASQVSMPVALGPLRYGEKFIMVGDHFQLPPLVKNEQARLGGLEESLFKMLCEEQPHAVCELTYQYRMCEDIAALSNFLIYGNKLKCGSKQVAERSISLPRLESLKKFCSSRDSEQWLDYVLDPKKKVVFLNYDNCKQLFEKNERNHITNDSEIDIVEQCVEGLLHAGVDCGNMGVMTLYRAQLMLLQKRFHSDRHRTLEVLTADQFQGRDKEAIIISLVRSNKEQNGGALLKELRRINVAMTRAKSKLIIVGSRATISSVPQMQRLINFLHEKGWIYELQQSFKQCYTFPTEHSQEADTTTTRSQRKHKQKHKGGTHGAANIRSDSNVVKNHPIIRQALLEF
ncbi:DNA2 (YHR164C) [Zygosaccharomyces parabailii]|nr:DNA2 (YHR164C) [Zygosaccharomyces parabailii]